MDRHLAQKLATRTDVAVRKLDIVSWDSPLAKHYLSTLSGLDLPALDRAIDKGTR